MEQPMQSSIISSAGAQHTITDYTSTTDMNASTRGDGTFGDVPSSVGSTQPKRPIPGMVTGSERARSSCIFKLQLNWATVVVTFCFCRRWETFCFCRRWELYRTSQNRGSRRPQACQWRISDGLRQCKGESSHLQWTHGQPLQYNLKTGQEKGRPFSCTYLRLYV